VLVVNGTDAPAQRATFPPVLDQELVDEWDEHERPELRKGARGDRLP
jgi:hypothetical protein